MKVIAVSGHAGSGKDTVGRMLETKLEADGASVQIMHYADLLKYICKSFFGWNGEKDEAGRTLIQYVGTDVVRKNNPDYWVNFIADMLDFFGESWDYVVIPDTRFPNEIDHLIERGFDTVHVRVERPCFESSLTDEQKSHESETALDETIPNYYITNDGDINDLYTKVSKLVTEELYGN